MDRSGQFYIDGAWVEPGTSATKDVIDPASEQQIGTVALADARDVDRAVRAARAAFDSFATTTRADRVKLLRRIVEVYMQRADELATTLSREIGAPMSLAVRAQVPFGAAHLTKAWEALESFEFERTIGTTTVVHEPVGVCALITPWNWPLYLMAAKAGPALAAGCTMVLKPSEIAPLTAVLFAEILHEAGVPAGVFNLVQVDGATAGAALTSHPEVDMVSFTGSTRAGIEVARNAAPTIKRVTQELGGKSANIVLDDADLDEVITRDVQHLYLNTGQNCIARSRMLVPHDKMEQASDIARAVTEKVRVGPPEDARTAVGPVVSEAQFNRVQALIQSGIDEGATLVVGGLGRPDGIERGFFVRPTVFADVTNGMRIGREEIFGPVLSLIGYDDEDKAVRIANDSPYGLSGQVSSSDMERARGVARRMRTGTVHLGGASIAFDAPFGGYKQSGNGREYGTDGLREYLETKSIFGDSA